ncbi:hypothetical protein D6764_05645, partial [Candidatus Woesearchaeota archaeon]
DQRFKTAVREYQKISAKYGEDRKKFNDIKKKVREVCKEDPESEACKEAQEEALNKAKEFLSNAIDVQIVYLEKLKSRIEASELLSEEEVQEILSEIDNLINTLEQLKEKVAEAENKDDIKAIAEELKDIAKKVKYRAQVHAGRIINEKVGEIVVRSEQLEKRLDCVLAQMEGQGIDTAAIDLMVDDFSNKVQSARDNWETAKKYFKEAQNLKEASDPNYEQVRQLVNLGKARVKEAHDDLKEAHKLLKEILKAIRNEGGSITSCSNEDSEEVAVISDDESSDDSAVEEEEEETEVEVEDESEEETEEEVEVEEETEVEDESGDDNETEVNETQDDSSDDSGDDSAESGEGSDDSSDESGSEASDDESNEEEDETNSSSGDGNETG